MGILNVTPDSFSDGGLHYSPSAAISAALRMMGEGADIIDVGGESTRPGAESVPEAEELRRVLFVVEALAASGARVSIDTMKPMVARAALQAGAEMVNDVTALRSPEMRVVCAEAQCSVCLMHMQGEPKTMQHEPKYDDVVGEVKAFLLSTAERAVLAGVPANKIWLDPGIGFGKTYRHNLELFRNLEILAQGEYPLMVGASRKAFLGRIGGRDGSLLPVEDRLPGSLAAHILSLERGASMIRAHDVLATRRAIDVWWACSGNADGLTI
jgi:dihydropteroate synthase